MDRKKFILLATTGAAAIAIPSWYFGYRIPNYDTALTEPGLLSNIWDEETMRVIGSTYRKLYPEENSKRKLIKLLSPGDAASSAQIALALQNQIKEDFEKKNIVIIDGWMLSVTEARQCAFYSYSTPS